MGRSARTELNSGGGGGIAMGNGKVTEGCFILFSSLIILNEKKNVGQPLSQTLTSSHRATGSTQTSFLLTQEEGYSLNTWPNL